MIFAVTGHRPSKLKDLGYTYDLRDPKWQDLKTKIKKFIAQYSCEEFYTGMALGVDQIAALAIIELKEEGKNIRLHAAIPCANQEKKWPYASQMLYKAILSKADTISFVSNEEYTPWCMQKRNEFMVDRADMILAIWDGSSGGTKNCVDYAEKKNKLIHKMRP